MIDRGPVEAFFVHWVVVGSLSPGPSPQKGYMGDKAIRLGLSRLASSAVQGHPSTLDNIREAMARKETFVRDHR